MVCSKCDSCTIVAFVDVFVKVFDGEYAICNFDVDTAVVLSTQVRIVRNDMLICEGMATMDNRTAIVWSFVFWIFVCRDDWPISKFFWVSFRAFAIYHTGRIDIGVSAWSMQHTRHDGFIKFRIQVLVR